MDVIEQKEVKTRKDHYCWGCGVVIPKGYTCSRSVSVDAGKIATSYWCDMCQIVLADLEDWQMQDGFAFGELKEYHHY